MAWPDFAYDLLVPLTSDPGWPLEVNTDGNMTFGVGGMAINFIGNTAGSESSYIRYVLNQNTISLGYWLTVPSVGPGYTGTIDLLTINNATGAYDSSPIVTTNYYHPSGGSVYGLFINGTTSQSINISDAGTYWVALNIVSGGTCTMRVWDNLHVELAGSPVSVTGQSNPGGYLWFGLTSPANPALSLVATFSNLVLDWTVHAYPHLGWATDPIQWTSRISKTMIFS